MIYQLPNPIDVATKLGDGTCIMIIDYGLDVNTVWVVRYAGGEVKHILSDDVRVYGNPMYGKSWDTAIPDDWDKYQRIQDREPFEFFIGKWVPVTQQTWEALNRMLPDQCRTNQK